MSSMVLLVESQATSLSHGNIFRVPGKYPYETWVDFMVFDTQIEHSPYGLIVVSGYKAGLILVRFPVESLSPAGGLDREWVVSNWGYWVYPECDVSNVYLIERYDAAPPEE